MAEKPLTIPDAAHQAGVDYLAAWRAVVGGRVPAQRVGTKWLVRASDLRRVLAPAPRPKSAA